jgi:hypothetical protein
LPLLDHDEKEVQVTNARYWFAGGAPSDNVNGVRINCDEWEGATGERVRAAWTTVRYDRAVLSERLSRTCADGTEIGELGPGGTLRWLVSPGRLTVTVYSYQGDGVRPWISSGTFEVQAGQVHRLEWKAGWSGNRVLLDGDIVMEAAR